MTLRWGILSTAAAARPIVRAAGAVDGVEVVAVASRDLTRAQAFAAEHGIRRAHGSYEALLADPEVDAVYVPLPNALHVPWSIRALEAGRHVLCEKPLARRAADAEAAFDAAERAGRVLMEGMMWRLHPRVETLGRLAREAVGEPRTARVTFRFDLPPGPDVRRDPALDGGALMDVGCYAVSALRLLCGGEPERVSAEAVIGPTGVDERVVATLRFPGDVLATLDCAMDTPPSASLELAGATGRLLVTDPWPVPARVTVDGREIAAPEPSPDPFAVELEEFRDAVRDGRPPRLGREDAVAQARALEALGRAMATNETVRLTAR
ncbi:MAG TPA: Gfo/Idh/MocA family oxidoreductase [Gaiellaceae bacterium]|nr:Gfo/Idh/MocA family oxidoreductase [Gaiellaceae bacterium]